MVQFPIPRGNTCFPCSVMKKIHSRLVWSWFSNVLTVKYSFLNSLVFPQLSSFGQVVTVPWTTVHWLLTTWSKNETETQEHLGEYTDILYRTLVHRWTQSKPCLHCWPKKIRSTRERQFLRKVKKIIHVKFYMYLTVRKWNVMIE